MNSYENGNFRSWGLYFAEGVMFLILGILALYMPGKVSVVLALILAWLLIIGGIVQFFASFNAKDRTIFFVGLLTAIVSLIFGVLLLARPVTGVMTITLLISAYLFVNGLMQIFHAFALRSMDNWYWLLISGLLSVILAILIWSAWPISFVAFLGIMLGINFFLWGLSLILLSFSIRRVQHHAVA